MVRPGYYSVPGNPGHGLHLILDPNGDYRGMFYGHDFSGRPTWLYLGMRPSQPAGELVLDAYCGGGAKGELPYSPMDKPLQFAGSVTLREDGNRLEVRYKLLRSAIGPDGLDYSPQPPDEWAGSEFMARLV